MTDFQTIELNKDARGVATLWLNRADKNNAFDARVIGELNAALAQVQDDAGIRFLILRGRNIAANHRLVTEVASPFDIWLHAEGGPGAHVLIKRDHPGQPIPERTLLEAAAIAGLASWQAGDAKARVMYAPAGEVRKIKGAALGRVRLESAASLVAAIDPEIEARLRISD